MDLPRDPAVPTQLDQAQGGFNFPPDHSDLSEYSHYASDFQFALNDSSASSQAPVELTQDARLRQMPLKNSQTQPPAQSIDHRISTEYYRDRAGDQVMASVNPAFLQPAQSRDHEISTQYYRDRADEPVLASVNPAFQQQQQQQSRDHRISTQYYSDRTGEPVSASINQTSQQPSQAEQQAFDPRSQASMPEYTTPLSAAALSSLHNPMPRMTEPELYHLERNDRIGGIPAQATTSFSGTNHASQVARQADMYNYYHNRHEGNGDL